MVGATENLLVFSDWLRVSGCVFAGGAEGKISGINQGYSTAFLGQHVRHHLFEGRCVADD